MVAVPKTDAERIDELETKLSDLAAFVGRLTDAIFGAHWDEYDDDDSGRPRLVWHEEIIDAGTPDEGPVGWWAYKPETQAEAA